MQNHSWLMYALLGAFFAGAVSVLSKRALNQSDYTVALSVQAVFMMTTLVILMLLMGRGANLWKLSCTTTGLLIAAGVCAALSWFCGYHALQLSNVATATPIDRLSLPIAVILAMIFLNERPSAWNWFGIALMLVGAIFVSKTKS